MGRRYLDEKWNEMTGSGLRAISQLQSDSCLICLGKTQSNYNPGPELTVGEQLVGFRGNQRNKVWVKVDVETIYAMSLQVGTYILEKNANKAETDQAKRIMLVLTDSLDARYGIETCRRTN